MGAKLEIMWCDLKALITLWKALLQELIPLSQVQVVIDLPPGLGEKVEVQSHA